MPTLVPVLLFPLSVSLCILMSHSLGEILCLCFSARLPISVSLSFLKSLVFLSMSLSPCLLLLSLPHHCLSSLCVSLCPSLFCLSPSLSFPSVSGVLLYLYLSCCASNSPTSLCLALFLLLLVANFATSPFFSPASPHLSVPSLRLFCPHLVSVSPSCLCLSVSLCLSVDLSLCSLWSSCG